MPTYIPGVVALFGSGETSPTGGVVYDQIVQRLPAPPRIAILETPAGFQPNSARVAGRVADFLAVRLQNVRPELAVVPARKRGTPWDPDNAAVVEPLQSANLIFLGPGSPTYAVRQLSGSLAWQMLLARQRRGAAVVTASAATIAVGALALPVYEIYKAGTDPHWQPGLDLFGPYGLRLVFVPHWNNTEGGADLDTSRCYMGQERFAQLLTLLPPDLTVVGIDEHTALIIDGQAGACHVLGRGGITIVRAGREQRFERKTTPPLAVLGAYSMPEPTSGIPPDVWQRTAEAPDQAPEAPPVPADVLTLVEQRQAARARRDWAAADALRAEIAARGWQVRDTPDGPQIARGV